jgi:hypothetical protein
VHVLIAERIEAMRHTLAVSSNSSVQDMESIQTTELLGEGTFGKVGRAGCSGWSMARHGMLCCAGVLVVSGSMHGLAPGWMLSNWRTAVGFGVRCMPAQVLRC